METLDRVASGFTHNGSQETTIAKTKRKGQERGPGPLERQPAPGVISRITAEAAGKLWHEKIRTKVDNAVGSPGCLSCPRLRLLRAALLG
jgi:hypothetical protein